MGIQRVSQRFLTGVHKYSPTLGHVGDMGWVGNRIRGEINTLRLWTCWNRLVGIDEDRIL